MVASTPTKAPMFPVHREPEGKGLRGWCMDASQLRALLRERPLVADGGMGSLIYQRLGYPRALCIEHTPLTHAETVLQIHLAYIAAGAESVHIATAAMVDPEVGLRIRRELA